MKKKINSRKKGASAERELAKILREKYGIEIKRNLNQTREGGYDLVGLEGFAIEVKRAEKLLIKKWWEQAVNQSEPGKTLPVLIYRQSRQPWSVVVPLNFLVCSSLCCGSISSEELVGHRATISLDAFIIMAKT